MKRFSIFLGLILSLRLLVSLDAARAQGTAGARPGELHGQVVRADGSPFGQGALVKIESEHGGAAAQVMTDSRGRFDVALMESSRYTVTVHAAGYRDETAEADLATVPRASIQITLHELPSAASLAPSPVAPEATVPVSDLNVPENAQREFDKGRKLLMDEHKSAESISLFRKAIQLAPSYSQAYFLLGTAYMESGKWSDAETSLEKAISFNGKLGPAYLALGSCLVTQKRFAEAEKPLLQGLEVNPDASRGHYDLGRAYYALNRFPEAEVHARKVVALEPDFPDARVLLGNVLLRLRDGNGALAEFQEYLRLAPKGPLAAPTQELVNKLKAALAAAH